VGVQNHVKGGRNRGYEIEVSSRGEEGGADENLKQQKSQSVKSMRRGPAIERKISGSSNRDELWSG